MPDSSKIVVDYLNFGLFKSLFRLKEGGHIFVLFHNRSHFIEKILLRYLAFKGVDVSFWGFNTRKSYYLHTSLADLLTQSFVQEKESSVVGSKYFANQIGRLYFARIYRIASIIEIVRNDSCLNKANMVFMATPHVDHEVQKYAKDINIQFYNSMGYANDLDCQSSYRPVNLTGFLVKLRALAVLCYQMFLVVPLSWPAELRVKAIFHVHPKVPERSFFEQQVITEIPVKSCLLNNSLKINVDGKVFNCRCLPLNILLPYVRHIARAYSLMVSSRFLPLVDRLTLLKEWITHFYLSQMIDFLNPTVFYSNYESNIALQLQDILESGDCISVASTYSAGYFPVKYEFSHQIKWADVFCVWGKYLSELYRASDDASKQHLVSGYPGDHFMRVFEELSNNNYGAICSPLIAVYDSSYADDLFLSKNDTFTFVESIARYAISRNAQIIIKTKKGNDLYSGLCAEFTGLIHLSREHASFAASMKADIVVGYLSSSPVLVSGAWGRQIILYDPYEMIWERGRKILSNYTVRTQEELFRRIDNAILSYGRNISYPALNEIDPFVDGDAAKRIANYLCDLIACVNNNKKQKIAYANEQYCLKNGSGYVIMNDAETFPEGCL